MKQVRVCRNCGKAVAKSLAYHAKVEKLIKTQWGEYKVVVLEGPLCPLCNESLGFKTSKKKLAKFNKSYNKQG